MCRVVSWELDALPGEGAGFRHVGGAARSTLSDSTSITGASEQHFSATQDETITRQLDEGVHWIDLQVGYNSGGTRSPAGQVVHSLHTN